MRNKPLCVSLGLALLLLLVACEGYSQTGVRSASHQTMSGGGITTSTSKANGTITEDIEVDGVADMILDADVTLSVGAGSFTIELLGQDDEVTLTLEARDGETVYGQGRMVTDAFGEASFRVTAVEAEDVEYTIDYTFR